MGGGKVIDEGGGSPRWDVDIGCTMPCGVPRGAKGFDPADADWKEPVEIAGEKREVEGGVGGV